MATLTRTRRSQRNDDDDSADEDESTPTRGRSRNDTDETPARARRNRGGTADEVPTSSRRSARHPDADEDDEPRHGRGRANASSGWGSYESKRRTNSKWADKFEPPSGEEVLGKFLDSEPFETFIQVWVDDIGKINNGRKSYVSAEYYDEECPLLALGYEGSTYSLFNWLDLSNPKKPEVKVWKASVTVADKIKRLAESKRSSPLNREDLYFAVTMTKEKKRTTWDIDPIKVDEEFVDEFGFEPFTAEELEAYDEDKFSDVTAAQQLDSLEDLKALAEELA